MHIQQLDNDDPEYEEAGVNTMLINVSLNTVSNLLEAVKAGFTTIESAGNSSTIHGNVKNNYCWMNFWVNIGSFSAGMDMLVGEIYSKNSLVGKDEVLYVPANFADGSPTPFSMSDFCMLYISSEGNRVEKFGQKQIMSEIHFLIYKTPPTLVAGGGQIHVSTYLII